MINSDKLITIFIVALHELITILASIKLSILIIVCNSHIFLLSCLKLQTLRLKVQLQLAKCIRQESTSADPKIQNFTSLLLRTQQ